MDIFVGEEILAQKNPYLTPLVVERVGTVLKSGAYDDVNLLLDAVPGFDFMGHGLGDMISFLHGESMIYVKPDMPALPGEGGQEPQEFFRQHFSLERVYFGTEGFLGFKFFNPYALALQIGTEGMGDGFFIVRQYNGTWLNISQHWPGVYAGTARLGPLGAQLTQRINADF